jgi:uncharacterized membrane protein YhiD involved in acid resistance
MDNLLNLSMPAPLSLITLAINLVISILLGSMVAWAYERYGQTFSNRQRLARILPVLSMVTVLIISVVKSSLALSLGLVGALSIVRFRTAIKEPEELVYLFIAIAAGLGLGADQRLPTVVAVLIMFVYLLIRNHLTTHSLSTNFFVDVAAPQGERVFAEINAILLAHVKDVNVRRLDQSDGVFHAAYLVPCPDAQTLDRLMRALHEQVPGCDCTFVEQDNLLSG